MTSFFFLFLDNIKKILKFWKRYGKWSICSKNAPFSIFSNTFQRDQKSLLWSKWVTLFMIYLLACWFFQINFSKKSFRNTIWVSNRLDPDRAWYSFRHHLGPICLQSLSADNTRVIEVISKANIKFLPAAFLSSDFCLNQLFRIILSWIPSEFQ